MEPPGPDVPGDADWPTPLGTLRLAAGVVTAIVAVVAHGPLVLLAVAVGLTLGSPAGAVVAALAAVATWIRWGSGWLVAAGGAQAVLGPAVAVGPVTAAMSTALVAVALLVAAPRSTTAAVALGLTAALLACGPAGSGGVGLRLLATAIAVAAAVSISRLGWLRWRTVAGVVAAAAAVAFALA